MFSSDNPVTATGGSTVLLGGSRFVNTLPPSATATTATTTTTTTTNANQQQQQQQQEQEQQQQEEDSVQSQKNIFSLNGTRRRGDWGMSAGFCNYYGIC